MRGFDNSTVQNQHTNMNGLIKGDFKKIEELPQTIGPEDITVNKFNVNASSVNNLVWISNQIECKLETYGVPTDKRQNLIIALVEAINNAQQHGYQFAKNKMVVINLFKIGARTGRGYISMKKSVDVLYVSYYDSYTEVFLGIFKENEKKN